MPNHATLNRRDFVAVSAKTAATLAAGAALTSSLYAAPANDERRRPRIAAVFTEFRFRSHAYNILDCFFKPYLFRGDLVDPGVDVVSFYADQFPAGDMARAVSKRFKVPLYETIDKALRLGGKDLAVDGVLLIGEHGNYPFDKLGRHLYPRKQMFDEVLAVMRASDRFVPVFNDKHLSYRWDWAKEMYDASRAHEFPLMAGSSVPLAERVPSLELPARPEFNDAVSIHGGGLESYDFHGLEVLQSIVEKRTGGETGISRVELLSGPLYKAAVEEGRWSDALVNAAMDAEKRMDRKRGPHPDVPARPQVPGAPEPFESPVPTPAGGHAIVVTYKDGLQGTVLRVGSDSGRWNFACRLKDDGKPRATALFNGPWGNRCLFRALSHAIQHLFVKKEEPYPVERTLLVTGALDAAMHSHARWGRPVETPHLEFAYKPADDAKFNENGESWKIITDDTPQPTTFDPGDARYVQ